MVRILSVILALLPVLPVAAEDPPPPSGNAVKNGMFAQTYDAANLWNGVDHDGFLAGPTTQMAALDEQGQIATQVNMPVSVTLGDLNGDQLVDILSADGLGYVRIYFNEGSAAEPKFGAGELSFPYLSRPDGDPPWFPFFGDMSQQKAENTSLGTDYNQWFYHWSRRRQAPRASLAIGDRGMLDLWVGNYFGEILLFRNEGSPTGPAFAQPREFPSALVPTTADPVERWGNLFAPVYADVGGDGRAELLIGEGSYSANNVHLLRNEGGAGRPVFAAAKRTQIALGEGRQQLSPAVADIDGNAKPDVLVADRAGRIAVYLHPAAWSEGSAFPFSGFVAQAGGLTKDFGQSLQAGDGGATLAAGDLNGDKLVDLVVGRSNGRIAWLRNTGTAAEPKFDPPQDIRSSASAPAISRIPEKWIIDTGMNRGNFGGYVTVLTPADDPSAGERGRNVLRLGYQFPPSKILQPPVAVFPGVANFNLDFDETGMDNLFRLGTNGEDFLPEGAARRMRGAPSNGFLLRTKLDPMAVGQTYTLSFDVKGSRVANGKVLLGWRGWELFGERKVRGERGAVRLERDEEAGEQIESAPFSVSGNWNTFTKDFRIIFKDNPKANKMRATSEAILEIYCELAPPDGVLFIDNVKLEPKP